MKALSSLFACLKKSVFKIIHVWRSFAFREMNVILSDLAALFFVGHSILIRNIQGMQPGPEVIPGPENNDPPKSKNGADSMKRQQCDKSEIKTRDSVSGKKVTTKTVSILSEITKYHLCTPSVKLYEELKSKSFRCTCGGNHSLSSFRE